MTGGQLEELMNTAPVLAHPHTVARFTLTCALPDGFVTFRASQLDRVTADALAAVVARPGERVTVEPVEPAPVAELVAL
ncbi:hypothetical protein DM785_02540 [Deinococcus actinosclerus]|nr:hypothetical protein DM785_02540 [Deinococcus actinosclerus]